MGSKWLTFDEWSKGLDPLCRYGLWEAVETSSRSKSSQELPAGSMVDAESGSELSDGYLSLDVISDVAMRLDFLIRSADLRSRHSLKS
jgi:hypothetical protein